MEKARKSKWTANISLCVCTLLYHIQGIHETAANIASVRNSAGSDERTALDQALLLVDLLKSEYAKVLKENVNLKRQNKFDEANVQSCATTTERMSENQNSKLFENMFQHRRQWRPRPAYDYYGDPIANGKWLRILDYYDANETSHTSTAPTTNAITRISAAHSSVAETTTKTTAKTTAKTSTKTTTEKSGVSISSITEKKDLKYNETVSTPFTTTITTINNEVDLKVSKTENKVRMKTSPSDTYTISNFVTIQSSSPRPVIKKLMLFTKKASEAKVISSTHMTQPELSQAAAELAKELGVAAPGGFGMGPRFSVLWRGTTKVYLADSTRYPLPLPENHAFCYTNPHSALCKTLV